MKKIISIMLALVMLLSFAACNKDKTPSTPQETVKIDGEMLKADWQSGKIVFPNGNSVQLPCKVSEFIEKSGLKIGNESVIGDKVLAPREELTLNIAGDGVTFKVTVRNTTSTPEMSYKDANVIEYNFNNTNVGNRQIKFAGTLTPGATREAVEDALGRPKGQKKDDTLYYYNGENSKDRKVKLIVSFNSDDIVNSVAYEIVYG